MTKRSVFEDAVVYFMTHAAVTGNSEVARGANISSTMKITASPQLIIEVRGSWQDWEFEGRVVVTPKQVLVYGPEPKYPMSHREYRLFVDVVRKLNGKNIEAQFALVDCKEKDPLARVKHVRDCIQAGRYALRAERA